MTRTDQHVRPPPPTRIVPGTSAWLLALAVAGCQSVPPPATATFDLRAPGWTVRQGQALWRPNARQPSLAGELLLATHTNGSAWIQFSKNPFVIVSGQLTPSGWHVEFPAQKRAMRGDGTPPSGLLWLQLPSCFRGRPLDPILSFHSTRPNRWTLEHADRGESIEGFLDTVRRPARHAVQPGDSVLGIGLYYGIDADALSARNPAADLRLLTPGTDLELPELAPWP